MLIAGIAFFFLLGTTIASFLNVCIDRLPAGQSLISPPSHCAECGHRLGPTDLIPIFSYLWLRGRCRYCGARISSRLLWVELGTGLLFGFFSWRYGLSWELLVVMVFSSIFIVLSVIDLDRQLILNKIVYPAALLALVIAIFLPPSTVAASGSATANFVPSFLPQAGIAQAAIGAGAGLVLFTIIIIVSRGGMGWGDAKMAGLVGAVTGYLIPLAVFVAVVAGGLLAVVLLVTGVRKRKQAIPFGPFLAIGAVVAVLWGNAIANWYTGRF